MTVFTSPAGAWKWLFDLLRVGRPFPLRDLQELDVTRQPRCHDFCADQLDVRYPHARAVIKSTLLNEQSERKR